jgi:hypothetical protein
LLPQANTTAADQVAVVRLAGSEHRHQNDLHGLAVGGAASFNPGESRQSREVPGLPPGWLRFQFGYALPTADPIGGALIVDLFRVTLVTCHFRDTVACPWHGMWKLSG